jgi:hypothetical protein
VGTGFKSGATVTVNRQQATSVTFVDSTELRAQLPAEAAGTYIIYVVNTDGSVALRVNGVTFSSLPTWTTASSLADGDSGSLINLQLLAADAATYTLAVGSTLPPGLTLSSSGLLSGTVEVLDETLYNFTVIATDTELQDSPRSFSINITVGDPYFNSNVLLLTGRANTFVKDASANNFPVTVVGDTKPSNFNPYLNNYSNFFDGTGDYLTTPSNAALALGTSDFTVECWVNATSTPSDIGIFESRTDGNAATENGFTLTAFSSSVIRIYSNGILIASSGTTYINTWCHVAVVRASGVWTLYVNGVSQGTSSAVRNMTNTDTVIGAGRYNANSTPNAFFPGYISNLRIVKGIAVYTANFTPPTQPLTAIAGTSLLTCQSNRIIDTSTNNFAIARTGDVAVRSFSPFLEPATTRGSGYFDGTGDYLSVPSNSAFQFGTGDFTIEMWVNPQNTGSTGLVENRSAPSNVYLWYLTATNLYPEFFTGVSYTGNISVPVGSWSHIAVSRQSGTLRQFVNGVLAYTGIDINTALDSTGGIRLMASNDAAQYLGYTSNIRIVKGTALYTANFTPPTQPLTAVSGTSLLTLQNNQPANNSTFLDSSSTNSLITRTGNTTQGSFSPYSPSGWSNYFDGTGDYLTVTAPTTLGTDKFTIEAWVYRTSASADENILVQGVGGTDGFGIAVLGGALRIRFGATNLFTSAATLTQNTWYHVALVRNGTTLTGYLNGISFGTSTDSSNQTATQWNIGHYGAGNYLFTGYISNLRVVKGTAVYTSNFTPSIQPLTAIAGTSLLTCADNRFVDKSANNFAVTSTGDVRVANWSPFAAQTQTPVSYSAYLDGTGDYLSVPSNSGFQFGSDNFTIECWVYINAFGTAGTWFAGPWGVPGGTNRSWDFAYYPAGGGIVFGYSTNGTDGTIITGSTTLSLNTWYHVAAVRSGNTCTIYQNGISIGSASMAGTTINPGTNSLWIGANPEDNGGSNFMLNGYISNLRVVKGTALYTANFTPPTQPLTAVAGTSLLTCQSATFADNSANRFAITAAGNSRPVTVNPFGSTFVKSSGYSAVEHSGSMYFDGTGDYLSGSFIPHRTSQLTVEAWVYITNRSVARCVFTSRSGNTTDGFQVLVDSGGEIRVGYAGTNFLNTAAATVVAGQWYHIAVTRNSANLMTIWVNGVAATTATVTANFSSTVFRAGITAENGSPMLGYISDLRVITGSSLYSSNFVPPETPVLPVANTTLLLNGTGAAIADATTKNDVETAGDAKISTAVSKFGGSSMYFDGSGDRFSVADSPNINLGSGNFTLECWVYFNAVNAEMCLINKGWQSSGAAYASYSVYMTNTGSLRFNSSSNGASWDIANEKVIGSATASTWNHIAITRAGSTFRAFVNGSISSAFTFTSTLALANISAQALFIGGRADGNSSINGYLQDVRITKGVARYTTSFTPPTNALRLK